jgi:iron complex outermembrane recepter protein
MSSNLTIRQAVGLAVGAAGTAAATMGFAPLALALDAAAGPNQDVSAAPDTTLQEVVVTGSRIRRVDAETASPVLVIDSQYIQASGIQTVGELVQQIPSVSGKNTNPAVNNGGGFGESTIELRGLNAQRTLVLVDGRRIGLVGKTDDATDINQIPIAMIERVEVLKEGAGAIYGSDAIGGVVNFITRKDIEGVELTADYGKTTHNDGAHHDVSVLFGSTTDKFNFVVGGSWQQQNGISAGSRNFSKYALYLYGGTTGVTKGGSSRVPTGRIFDNPLGLLGANGKPCASLTRIAGAAGSALTDYRCYRSPADNYNYQPLNLIMTPVERASAFSKANYKINDDVEAYATLTANHTHSGFQIAPLPFDSLVDNVVLSKNSIYNPFGIDFGGASGANPDFTERLTSLGDRRSDTITDSTIINGGVKGNLPGDWKWDLNLSYSRMDQHAVVSGYYFNSLLNAALGPSFIAADGTPTCGTAASPIPGCIPVNFFNPTTPSQIAAINSISSSYNTDNTYRYKAAALDFNGKIVDLPGGGLLGAAGVSYDDRHQISVADSAAQALPPLFLNCQLSQETCTGNTIGGYNSKQVYVEFFVPLLKDLPGVHALNVDVGVRYSDYSLFGNATKGDLKLEYRPVADLLVRGTYSQVFRVPTVSDIAGAPSATSVTFNDPCTNLTSAQLAANANLKLACAGVVPDTGFKQPNGQITGLNTSNPNLKPEKGHVITAGFVLDPHWVPGLSFDVDYWKYHIDGLITLLDSNYSISQCVATGNPTFCSLVHRFTTGAASNLGLIQEFVNPEANLGSLDTDGVDMTLKYALKNTPVGSFQFSVDWTHTLTYKNDPAPGAAVQEIAGTYNRQFGNYAKDRGFATIGWSGWGADALISARYIGSLVLYNPSVTGVTINSAGVSSPYPPLQIPSFVYLDLTVGYTFPTKTRVQVGARNLSDKQPPILYQNNVTNGNTDVEQYDTLGRQWFAGFTQKF